MKPLLTVLLAAAATLFTAVTAQAQTPVAAPPSKSVQVLVGHLVAHGLAAQLIEGSGITLARAAPATLPPARQLAYFEGRGAKALAQAAAQADAVITMRSLWPQDPLFPLARRANIRIVEIDAARPIDGALPGIALQPGADLGSYPWLHPVNLGRMADILATDLERLAPQAAPVLARNLAGLKQQLVALSGRTESALLAAPNLTVVSLSPRLDYLASAFHLELVPGSADTQALAALIRSEGVAAVLHHEELPAELAQAVTAAGAAVVVLATDGQQPVADMAALAARLVDALRPR
ncbi:metal ABC transporter solute-binding protein, Zn/Mn family [Pantoea sp. 18069]|uniref:metal ABC transporter solute-binding protein, Zn/Mn family n=1 Tax=Pantoea sp. 18069 TaxID=2681415 RepID=UPI00190FAEC1|nr:zinc ABC transporter substrate-binding protein [Pantoea sp. 18069]